MCAVSDDHARLGGSVTTQTTQTDLWTVTHRGDRTERAWWQLKGEALTQVVLERRERGCDCEAPPWFSEPGEWPMRILLAHNPGCATIRTPERETVLPLHEEGPEPYPYAQGGIIRGGPQITIIGEGPVHTALLREEGR